MRPPTAQSTPIPTASKSLAAPRKLSQSGRATGLKCFVAQPKSGPNTSRSQTDTQTLPLAA